MGYDNFGSVWDRSRRVVDRLAGNISMDNKFQSRPIISSDSPRVEGGVYLGSGPEKQ